MRLLVSIVEPLPEKLFVCWGFFYYKVYSWYKTFKQPPKKAAIFNKPQNYDNDVY